MLAKQTKTETLLRYLMVYGLSSILPLYIVNEFPKSGGSWMGQMLSRALDVPFPRNKFPKLQSSVLHGHYLYPGIKNTVIVWRDGRDVIVSWYHHCLFGHKSESYTPVVSKLHDKFNFTDYDDLYTNLPVFIEHCFTNKFPMKFSWKNFVRKWIDVPDAVTVRYEDLRLDGANELHRVVSELTGQELPLQICTSIIEEFSFKRQAGRKPGEENKSSFLRKGIVGDWKNYFSLEARQIFDEFAGEELIQLGYEKDRSWVTEKEYINNDSRLTFS